MTRSKHFKARVRARQEEMGGSFSTARAVVDTDRKDKGAPLPDDAVPNSGGMEVNGARADEVVPTSSEPLPDVPASAYQPKGDQSITSGVAADAQGRSKERVHTAPSWDEWVARNRRDDAAMAELARTAIRRETHGRHVDGDKIAAWAKAALIREIVDGMGQIRSPFAHTLQQMYTLRDDNGVLSIDPDDGTPVSQDVIYDALTLAAARAGVASFQQGDDWPSGKMVGATPHARVAATRFIRLSGGHVIVQVLDPPRWHPAAAAMPAGAAENATTDGADAVEHVTRGKSLTTKAESLHGVDAEKLFAVAGGEFEAAIRLDRGYCEARTSWGQMLVARARNAPPAEALLHLAEAARLNSEAIAIRSDFFTAFIGLGNAQLERARLEPKQAAQLIDSALAQYREALNLNPNLYLARAGMGSALLERARRLHRDAAGDLLAQAEAFFEAALQIKPNSYIALAGLGDTYVEQAKMAAPTEAEAKLTTASERFQRVLAIKPDSFVALCGVGDVLLEQARRSTGEHRIELQRLARAQYDRALAIQPNSYRAANARRSTE